MLCLFVSLILLTVPSVLAAVICKATETTNHAKIRDVSGYFLESVR